MINQCQKTDHRWEFWDCEQGATYFRCKACGEVMEQYHDLGSGA